MWGVALLASLLAGVQAQNTKACSSFKNCYDCAIVNMDPLRDESLFCKWCENQQKCVNFLSSDACTFSSSYPMNCPCLDEGRDTCRKCIVLEETGSSVSGGSALCNWCDAGKACVPKGSSCTGAMAKGSDAKSVNTKVCDCFDSKTCDDCLSKDCFYCNDQKECHFDKSQGHCGHIKKADGFKCDELESDEFFATGGGITLIVFLVIGPLAAGVGLGVLLWAYFDKHLCWYIDKDSLDVDWTPLSQPYYVGEITRQDAEQMMIASGKSTFLVRYSSNSQAYTLSKYKQPMNKCFHFLIKQGGNGDWYLEGDNKPGSFRTLKKLMAVRTKGYAPIR